MLANPRQNMNSRSKELFSDEGGTVKYKLTPCGFSLAPISPSNASSKYKQYNMAAIIAKMKIW